jgi:uncharacterized protein
MTIQQYPYYFKKYRDQFLVVNMVGEHIFLLPNDFEFFVTEKYSLLSEYAKMQLYSRNFISDSNEQDLVEDLLAVKLRSRKNFLSYFTSLHMVVLTLRCNCFCDYCHASSQDLNSNETDMSLTTAKRVLDTILESPSPDIKIEFQGGEPSLNWPVLEYFVLEGEKRIKKTPGRYLSFVICTNLFEISSNQLSFLNQHHVCISTSCDGPKKLYDLHRKARDHGSAFDKFIRNLAFVRNVKGEDSVDALLTVTKDNLHFLKDVIDFYIKLRFHSVFIRALNPYGYARKNKKDLDYSMELFVREYKKALLYIIELNKNGIFFIESYASLLFQRIMTPFSTGFVDLQSPAGAGISGAIYYYNGDVYPADEARMLAAMGDDSFKLGNVFDNTYLEMFFGDTIKKLVLNSCVESMPECSTCVYNPYCGADPIRNYVESQNIVGKRYNSDFCKKNKGIIDVLFDIIKENDSDTMAVLWSWVFRKPVEEWQCGKQKE